MDVAQLITACRRNDAAAQRRLYEEYLPYVFTVLRRFGVPDADRPDLIQDIFVSVFSGLARFDPKRGELKHWISGISVHRIVAYQKRRRRFRPEELTILHDAQLAVKADVQHLDAEYLLRHIESLPDGYRTVFNLYVVDGYSHEEISRMLDITVVGSRSQLSRAKSLLRKKLLANRLIKTTHGTI